MNDRDINQNEPENEEDTNPSNEDMRNMMDMWHGTIDQHEEEERLREKITQLREKITQLEGELSRSEKKSDTKKQPGEIQRENTSGVFSSMFQAIAAMSKTTRIAILCAGIFAALLAVTGVFSLFGSAGGLFRGWGQPRISANLNTVVTAVKACGELTTYKAYFEAVADHKEESRIPGRSRKILIIFGGTVDCGLDMKRANMEIFEAEKKINIILPHCIIQRVYVEHEESRDITSVRVYHEEVGTLVSHFSAGEQNKILGQAVTRIREKHESGTDILLQAEKSARDLFTNFLSPFGYKVTVEFTDDPERLKPSDSGERIQMNSGGIIIIHEDPNKKSKEEAK